MNSLRGRLTLAIAIAGTVLLSGLVIAGYVRARTMVIAQFDDGLRTRASALATLLLWKPDGALELDFKEEFMPELEQPGGGFYFAVWRQEDGALVEQSSSLAGSVLPRFGGSMDAPERRELMLSDGSMVRALGIIARPEEDDELPAPSPAGSHAAIVVVAGDTTLLHARLRDFMMELAGGGAVALGLLGLVVRGALSRGLKPLARVSEFAARLNATRLEERMPLTGLPSELTPIAARLNDLLARLQRAFERERRFSADVAHELHTPISELRALAEVGARIPGTNPETAAFFGDAGDIATRLETTVATLRLLARCEGNRQPVDRRTLRLGDLLSPEMARVKSAASERSLAFTEEIPSDLNWNTDPELLCRLVHLLLDNALEYTARPGSISVRAGSGFLSVSNGPTDLSAADLPHLGERFWRKDAARADGRHAGLGLALAVELARILELRLESSLGPDQTLIQKLMSPGGSDPASPACS